jgi:hypothetical protein
MKYSFLLFANALRHASIWLVIAVLVQIQSFAQDSTKNYSIKNQINLNTWIGGGSTPFWLRANQYGIVPTTMPAVSVGGQSVGDFIIPKSKLKWGYGAEVIVNAGAVNQIVIPVAFLKTTYKKWEMYVGRRRETFGISDTTLGTGSYVWSGNALPMPKIQIGTTDYISLKFTKNWIALKGNYAHGWFGSETFVNNYYLHQKTLYGRIGKPGSKLKLYGGFNHQVQWGGTTNYESKFAINNKLPSSFKDYIYVVTGALGYKERYGTIDTTTATDFDITNRFGNHLGSIDLAAEYETKQYRIRAYRQSLYEDGSLFYGTNITDGLHGVSIKKLNIDPKNKKIIVTALNIEFLDTRSQGGPTAGDGGVWGKDNYFNHGQFRDGWYYKGNIIGTPFISTRKDLREGYQQEGIYNGYENINNNRLTVWHLGLEGYCGTNIHFLSKLSYSTNLGTYDFTYTNSPRQISGLLQLDGQTKLWRGMDWVLSAAYDSGQLLKNNFAIRAGIKKKI